MTIKPITPTVPACYGVVCPQHGECTRYAAVEASPELDRIATCDDGAGARPLFVAVTRQAQQPEAVAA